MCALGAAGIFKKCDFLEKKDFLKIIFIFRIFKLNKIINFRVFEKITFSCYQPYSRI
jgi:hypothetical protein